MSEFGEAIEFDIPRYWPGRRLHDLFTGKMTWRELLTFVRQAPADSALKRAIAIRRGQDPDWTLDTYIARVIANTLIAANYQRAGKHIPEAALIPEPGKQARATARARANGHRRTDRKLTQADFDALF